jgi:hypothetical protein
MGCKGVDFAILFNERACMLAWRDSDTIVFSDICRFYEKTSMGQHRLLKTEACQPAVVQEGLVQMAFHLTRAIIQRHHKEEQDKNQSVTMMEKPESISSQALAASGHVDWQGLGGTEGGSASGSGVGEEGSRKYSFVNWELVSLLNGV